MVLDFVVRVSHAVAGILGIFVEARVDLHFQTVVSAVASNRMHLGGVMTESESRRRFDALSRQPPVTVTVTVTVGSL